MLFFFSLFPELQIWVAAKGNGTVVWLALSPPSKKVQSSNLSFSLSLSLCGVCMFSLRMRGFSLGTPVSDQSKLIVVWVWMVVCVCGSPAIGLRPSWGGPASWPLTAGISHLSTVDKQAQKMRGWMEFPYIISFSHFYLISFNFCIDLCPRITDTCGITSMKPTNHQKPLN